MLYNIIQIRPNYVLNKWDISFASLDGEREEKQTFPNPLGYYHYPSNISKSIAFEELKKCMIEQHQQEIEKLQKSLQKLKELKYESVSSL